MDINTFKTLSVIRDDCKWICLDWKKYLNMLTITVFKANVYQHTQHFYALNQNNFQLAFYFFYILDSFYLFSFMIRFILIFFGQLFFLLLKHFLFSSMVWLLSFRHACTIHAQIMTLNPSTDLLVAAQYGPVSEIAYQPPQHDVEETRKLMANDNKEWWVSLWVWETSVFMVVKWGEVVGSE